MYEIKQKNGESYIVNSKHTLVLKYSGNNTIHRVNDTTCKVVWFDSTSKKGRSKKIHGSTIDESYTNAKLFLEKTNSAEIIEMTVDEYMTLDKWTKLYLMGYKSTSEIHWPNKDVSLDPYLLGLWLGDGTHSHPVIASNDIEIQRYLLNWCQENNAELVHDEGVKFRIRQFGASNGKGQDRKSIGYGSSCESCKGCSFKKQEICDSVLVNTQTKTTIKCNPFTQQLIKYNLLNNKHIPDDFMMNSRDVRLQLLAGLIDTDGCVSNEGKRAVISQVNPLITEQIVLLCKSLDFNVNVSVHERKNISIFGGDIKDYPTIHTITISGSKLYEIPTKLPRKQCIGSTPNKDYSRTSIHVSPIGNDTYYGWIVDGNHRFLHKDFTVLRNCSQMFCTQCNTPFDWTTGKKITTGAIHNPHYFEYLRKVSGGEMPRNSGDIPCGGRLPDAWAFQSRILMPIEQVIKETYVENDTKKLATGLKKNVRMLYDGLRWIQHVQHVEIPRNTNNAEDMDNTDYNLRYLKQEIDEKRWKQLLQQKEKRRMKREEVRQVLEAFCATCVDIYAPLMGLTTQSILNTERGRVSYTIPSMDTFKSGIEKAMKQITSLRKIFNCGMLEISRRFKCQVPSMDDNLRIGSTKYSRSTGIESDPDEGEEETSATNVLVQIPSRVEMRVD